MGEDSGPHDSLCYPREKETNKWLAIIDLNHMLQSNIENV